MRRRQPMLTNAERARAAPHLPTPKAKPHGGRPRAKDRACLEGDIWVLRPAFASAISRSSTRALRRVGAGWGSGNGRTYGSP